MEVGEVGRAGERGCLHVAADDGEGGAVLGVPDPQRLPAWRGAARATCGQQAAVGGRRKLTT